MTQSPRVIYTLISLSATLAALPAFAKPMTAVLRLNERVPLEDLARNAKTFSAQGFGAYYSPEDIRSIAGPTDQEYAEFVSQLSQEGFEITSESPTHLWISVKADSQVFERVFSAKISFTAQGTHSHTLLAGAPNRFPLVASVTGLDSTRKAHPMLKHTEAMSSTPGGIPQDTIKSAYGFSPIYQSGWTGKGQHIAIATYNDFHIEDVQSFYASSNLPSTPTVDKVNFNGTATLDENSAMETELDAEFSGMIAPGANIHVFTSATNDDAGELQMFTAILDDNRAKVVNYSWGDCETNLSSSHAQDMAKVYARAVAQGVNIMVASGDSGSDSCQNGSTVADWPAASPDVVAVGGTSFQQSGSQIADTAWNGSGGGISGLWNLPTWQSNLGSTYVKRSYPDVAFNADPNTGQAIWTQQDGQAGWITVGGTSMAAPQWSGFLALVAEARAAQGRPTIGFINPIIYGLSSSKRAQLFNDVTSGSNGAYSAGPGWDAVTGFGSMQAQALHSYLVSQ